MNGGGCYLVVPDAKAWLDAEYDCEARGGHLVIIDGAAENNLLLAFAPVAQYPWIGLTDHAVEGVFLWVDDGVPGYTHWNAGEPNDSGWGGEDCAQMRPDGTWNDSDCAGNQPYVCEADGRTPGRLYW